MCTRLQVLLAMAHVIYIWSPVLYLMMIYFEHPAGAPSSSYLHVLYKLITQLLMLIVKFLHTGNTEFLNVWGQLPYT